MYEDEAVPLLLDSIAALCDRDSLILVSFDMWVFESIELFHRLALERFDVEKIATERHHPVYRTQYIEIVRLRKR